MGVNRNHSVRPSVCAYSCQADNFFWFNIGLLYLPHGCVIMRWCVAYIMIRLRPWNLTSRSNSLFLKCFRFWLITFFGLTYLTIFGTWVYHHDAMCHKHSWTPYDLDLWPQGLIYRLLSCLHVWPVTSVFWHWHTIFGIWVYHHERMCQVHSWSWYDVDLWPQGQIYMVYDMALCSGLSFFVLWHSHTLFGTWVYHHDTICRIHSWTLYDLDLWPQYQNYIFTMDLNLATEDVFAFWHRHTKFSKWVYHH